MPVVLVLYVSSREAQSSLGCSPTETFAPLCLFGVRRAPCPSMRLSNVFGRIVNRRMSESLRDRQAAAMMDVEHTNDMSDGKKHSEEK